MSSLTNKEIRQQLLDVGANPGPVTDSTRDVWLKKLDKLKGEKSQGSQKISNLTKVKPAPAPKRKKTPPRNSKTVKKATQNGGSLDSDSEDNGPNSSIIRRSPSRSPGRRLIGRPANNIIPGLEKNSTIVQQPKLRLSTSPTNTIDYTLSKRMSPRKSPRILEADETPPSGRSFNFGESTDEDDPPIMLDRSANTSFARPSVGSISRRAIPPRSSVSNYAPMTSSPIISPINHEVKYPPFLSNVPSPLKSRVTSSYDSDISPPILSSTRREGSWSPIVGVKNWLGKFRAKNSYQRAPAGSYEFKKWNFDSADAGRIKRKQWNWPKLDDDTSRMLVGGLLMFLVFITCGYLASAHRPAVAYTYHIVKGAAIDTVNFIYHNLILPILFIAFVGAMAASIYYYRRYKRTKAAEEQRQVFQMVDRIIGILRSHEEDWSTRGRGKDASMAVPHVRDAIFQPSQRSGGSLRIWDKAVEYLNENESRVRTETKFVGGQECMVWTWVPPNDPDEDEKVWMGRAFAGEQASLNVPRLPFSDCLKLRGMFDPELELEPDWTDHIQDVLLEKLGPNARATHIAVDTDSKEGCVYMKLKTKEDAGEAFKTLHGSWFNGRLVSVKYVRTERYHQRFPEAQRASIALQVKKPRHSILWNN